MENFFKKLSLVILISLFAFSCNAAVIAPFQGGTGTSTTPFAGQLLIGTTGGIYSPAWLTAGTNVTIATSSGGITISSTGGGGGGAWSTSTGLIYATDVVLVGGSATTSGGYAFEIIGNSLFDGIVASGSIVGSNISVASTTIWDRAIYLTTASSTLWSTAYSWGNHALVGYLTSYTESDPIWNAASSSFLTITSAATNYVSTTTGLTYFTIINANASNTSWLADIYWTGTATNLVAATGRTSLGLGTMAVANTSDYLATGTAATTYFTISGANASNTSWLTDTNTTYSASGTLLNLTGTNFSVNAGTLTNTKGCIYTTGTGIVCNSTFLTAYTETDPVWNAASSSFLTTASAATNYVSTTTGLTYFTTSGANASNTSWLADITWTGTSVGLVAATGRTSLGLGTMALGNTTDYLATGTAASTYVPYTGATADVDIGNHNFNTKAGVQFFDVTTGSSTIAFYANNDTEFVISGADGGKVAVWNLNLLTDERTFTFPDVNGTFALGTGLAKNLAYWSATNTIAGLVPGSDGLCLIASSTATSGFDFATCGGGSDIYWTGTSTNLVAATGRTSLGLGDSAVLASSTFVKWTDASTTIWNNANFLTTASSTLWSSAYNIVNTSLTAASSTLWSNAYGIVNTSLTNASSTLWSLSHSKVNASSSIWDKATYLSAASSTLWSTGYVNASYVSAASSSLWSLSHSKVNASSSLWDAAKFLTQASSTLWSTAYDWGNHKTGFVGTGVYDFGGVTSFEIWNSATLATGVTGQIGIDTTSDQLRFMGASATRTVSYIDTKCASLENATGTDTAVPIFDDPYNAFTVTKVSCQITGTGAYATVAWKNNGTTMATSTCTTTYASSTTMVSNSVTAGKNITWTISSASGTAYWIKGCFSRTINSD